MLVALELDNGIDDVFEDFRTGEGAFLRDMTNEDDGNAAGLGKAQQGRGALANLGNGAGRGFDVLGGNGLDGIDDDEVGLDFLDVVEDGFEGVFGENEEVISGGDVGGRTADRAGCGGTASRSEAFGAHLELVGAFLTADVEHALVRQSEHGLEGER